MIADALSRAMLDTKVEKDDVEDVHNLLMFIPMCEDQLQNLKTETEKDEILCELKKVIVSGWPERDKLDIKLTPYHSYADELSVCVLQSERRKNRYPSIHEEKHATRNPYRLISESQDAQEEQEKHYPGPRWHTTSKATSRPVKPAADMKSLNQNNL